MNKSIVHIGLLAGISVAFTASPLLAAGAFNNSDVSATAVVYTIPAIISQNSTQPFENTNQQGDQNQNQNQNQQGDQNQNQLDENQQRLDENQQQLDQNQQQQDQQQQQQQDDRRNQ